jgi:hypothetical protein
MTPIAEAFKKEHPDKKDYWQNELKSLGIELRRQNELNDKDELQALAEIIKEVYSKITKRHIAVILIVIIPTVAQIFQHLKKETSKLPLYFIQYCSVVKNRPK